MRRFIVQCFRVFHCCVCIYLYVWQRREKICAATMIIIYQTLKKQLFFLLLPFESRQPECVPLRLPKVARVSRKARGEITPALSLLSGPHPSVIVQVIL